MLSTLMNEWEVRMEVKYYAKVKYIDQHSKNFLTGLQLPSSGEKGGSKTGLSGDYQLSLI